MLIQNTHVPTLTRKIRKSVSAALHRWTALPRLLLCATALSTTGIATAAYPDKPVTLIVPFGVGSSTDIMTRQAAKLLDEKFPDGNFIVDNRPGAMGTIGSNLVARAKPDGYTLLVGTGTTHTQVPWMMKSLPYDPIKDFEPVAGIGGVPLAILVAANSPLKSMDDFIKEVKSSPKKYGWGTAFGMATVCGEEIRQTFNLDLQQIPYKSSAQALTDLIGGQILMLCTDFNSSMGAIRGNQVRALAVTTKERNDQLPDVPSIMDTIPAFPEMRSWVGVFAPKGTPSDITTMLADAVLDVTASPEFLEALKPNGFGRLPLKGQEMTQFIQSELVKWKELIHKAGIEPM